MIRLVSWNTAFSRRPWLELAEMDVDVALLQETCTPPPQVLDTMEFSPYKHWLAENYTLTALRPARVVKTSDRVSVEWFEQVEPRRGVSEPHHMAVGDIGLCDAAKVTPKDGTEPFIVVSMYAGWQSPHPVAGPGLIFPDASAHHIISDLSTFVPTYDEENPGHRIIAAGDLNVAFNTIDAFEARARTILDRMSALGMEYLGPLFPNGRKAEPVPPHLAEESLEVPTYHTVAREPATAHVQIDHVFASRGFHNTITTRAMNHVEEWGSSDHCRILINLETPCLGTS